MKKTSIILLLVLLSTFVNAAYVRVQCSSTSQSYGLIEIQDGNGNIIGTSNPYYNNIIYSTIPSYINFEINESLANTWVRLKGYDSNTGNCDKTEWTPGTWSGVGTQLNPFLFSTLMEIDVEPHDIRIVSCANIERTATITIAYEGTDTPNGYTPSSPIIFEDNLHFTKGWNNMRWDNISSPSFGGPSTWTVYVTEEGVENESYSNPPNCHLVYSPDSQTWVNYPGNISCFENKPLNKDWNWESFPKLPFNATTNNSVGNVAPLFNCNTNPSDFTWFQLEGDNSELEFSNRAWDPLFYNIKSSNGVKIKLDSTVERSYIANGTRVLPSTSLTLNAGWNWVGYWMPGFQLCDEAFGSDWSKVNLIMAEDWYYDNLSQNRGISKPLPASNTPMPFHYGEGYMIKMHEAATITWATPSYSVTTDYRNYTKPEPQNFVYEKKADYDVIDIVDISPEFSEIGVFQDDICVGAVVVQDSTEQILVYTDQASRDSSIYSFQVITERDCNSHISKYQVYNKDTAKFEDNPINLNREGYSIVKFENITNENDSSTNDNFIQHNNYPNPFNPTTTISLNLPIDQNVSLEIFNIKGQKVTTIYSGKLDKGKHSMVWNGTNSSNKAVASGVYFYKLQTADETFNRKMLLMK